ncbi:MAG: hypothetical protein Q7R33_08030 [Nitrosarchaeum sp.]|nr:hypothetical protein [Nitrosarchaeum sp.]
MRKSLSYLTIVLQRRKAYLIELYLDESIPNGIREIFVNKQMKLIKSVIKDIIKIRGQSIMDDDIESKMLQQANVTIY